MANVTDAKTWRKAAKGGNRGREIFQAMQSLMHTKVGLIANQRIVENAALIRSLPLSIAQQVNAFVTQQTFKGLRSSEIAEHLQSKVAGYSKARANLIARTETSKAMTELTRARAEDLGIEWYIWRTSEDSRVRSSHDHMEGVLIRWSDPPAPEELIGEKSLGNYHAGGIFNCRCFPRPLISLNNVKWPCKVYINGSIQRLTKEQFHTDWRKINEFD